MNIRDVPSSLLLLVVLLSGATDAAVPAGTTQVAYLGFTSGYWQVWVSDSAGREAKQLTHSRGDKTRVSWFPDRQQLLVNTNQGDVWTVDLRGTEHRVALGVEPVLDAVIGPDGRRIAFSFGIGGSRDGNDIWVVRLDGSGRELLRQMPALQHEPVWSPDGRLIYFLSSTGLQAHDIWRYDFTTHAVEQVTNDTLYHFDIAVSPAGRLAYSSNISGPYELYLDQPGEKPKALTHDDALDAHPCFLSEDELIFESAAGGVPNIWHLDLRSGQRHKISRTSGGARAPACPYSQGVEP